MEFVIGYIIVGVIFGLIGGNWAKTKGLDAVTWGILCGLFPIALVGLAMISPDGSGATGGKTPERWRILTEVDTEVAAAAAEARAFGPQYENRLAEKYFTL